MVFESLVSSFRKKEKKFPINDRIIKLFRVVSSPANAHRRGCNPFFSSLFFLSSFFFFSFFLRSSVTFSQSLARCSVNASKKTTDLHDMHRYIEIKRGGLIGGKNVDKKMAVSRHVN